MNIKKRGGVHPVDLFVGKRLRVLRQSRSISQEKMAFRVGLTFQQIQKYEKGLNRISCSKLYEFSKLLSVRVQDFFEGFVWNGEDNGGDDALADSSADIGYIAGGAYVGDRIGGVSERELEKIVSAVVSSEEDQLKEKVTKVLRVLGKINSAKEDVTAEALFSRYEKKEGFAEEGDMDSEEDVVADSSDASEYDAGSETQSDEKNEREES